MSEHTVGGVSPIIFVHVGQCAETNYESDERPNCPENDGGNESRPVRNPFEDDGAECMDCNGLKNERSIY